MKRADWIERMVNDLKHDIRNQQLMNLLERRIDDRDQEIERLKREMDIEHITSGKEINHCWAYIRKLKTALKKLTNRHLTGLQVVAIAKEALNDIHES